MDKPHFEARGELRAVDEFNGKYWITRRGRVYRMEAKDEYVEVATSGVPRRVRFYFNGKETRPHVYPILVRVWGKKAILTPEIQGFEMPPMQGDGKASE